MSDTAQVKQKGNECKPLTLGDMQASAAGKDAYFARQQAGGYTRSRES